MENAPAFEWEPGRLADDNPPKFLEENEDNNGDDAAPEVQGILDVNIEGSNTATHNSNDTIDKDIDVFHAQKPIKI